MFEVQIAAHSRVRRPTNGTTIGTDVVQLNTRIVRGASQALASEERHHNRVTVHLAHHELKQEMGGVLLCIERRD